MCVRSRIYHDIEHNTEGRKLKLCSDFELTKDTQYLVFMGELCGVFCEFFVQKIPREHGVFWEHWIYGNATAL